MADNVYLLETRLSSAQQQALDSVRTVARQQGLTVFLVGGAVRDLISGSPVRDLDVAVQGNALKLRKELEEVGAIFSGSSLPLQSLYVRFPSGVRVEVGSTLSSTYPKPGKPVYQPTTILEDLRRRDFTANAMALSLNEGSYGLLMDPLNGVADIENRELRLVSNYGFIEDPARLIRAARFMARLGWQMDDRTRTRYETAKEEDSIAVLQPADRGYEVEELFHEEEPLRVIKRLEEEGWLQHLSPVLSAAKVNAPELARLREAQMQLESRGIRADAAAANFPLLTGKIPAPDLEALKKSFPGAAFVSEINGLEAAAKELSGQLLSKATTLPSEAYKLIMQADPVTVLWAFHSTKSAALQTKFKSFLNDWPQAQQKIPVLLMTEMRITSELPEYAELQQTLFYALMDGRLTTPEEMRAFLEPYSPPAPPPPISLRRPRAPRKEAKAAKSRKKAAVEVDTDEVPATTPATEATVPEAAVPAQVSTPAPEKKAGKTNQTARSSTSPAAKDVSSKKLMSNHKAVTIPASVKAATQRPSKSSKKHEPAAPVRSSAKATKPATARGRISSAKSATKSVKPKPKVAPSPVRKLVPAQPTKKPTKAAVSVKKVVLKKPVSKKSTPMKKATGKKIIAKRK